MLRIGDAQRITRHSHGPGGKQKTRKPIDTASASKLYVDHVHGTDPFKHQQTNPTTPTDHNKSPAKSRTDRGLEEDNNSENPRENGGIGRDTRIPQGFTPHSAPANHPRHKKTAGIVAESELGNNG
ncbi:hypothetical protein ACJRO7_031713 [Eucalyptus globulus]|uniref:Uncharacterized protein n=1 Tax=Eucalyptus globulus TaxID=34317 RepID=A0ABD3JTN0_EUCGL